ncbi:MAG: hypothetical protein BWX80_02689 [Candidatus Hydrogenedentes bacterium ADurb.Bin101]|nr:MAG: hypothetical protein BWX80_02689 [Candidatus Hydrogenedentes bacterium ADurb.Bin101]
MPWSMAKPNAKNPAFAGAIATASMPILTLPATKANTASSCSWSQASVRARSGSKGMPKRPSKVGLSVGSASPMTMQSGSRRRI